MRIRIPDINGEEKYIEGKQSIVLVGANGAGKTRMSVWIEENNSTINVHRISAQKSLAIPKMVSPTELETAEEKLLYGTTNENKEWLRDQGKRSNRWGREPEVHMLNDFQVLMEYLVTESYEKSIKYREAHKSGQSEFDNETKLEKIKGIWESVITHRKLKICAGKLEVINVDGTDSDYNGSEMSDGERAIFYYIAEILCAKENSLVIIDEPENHLHKSILVRLWDAIEAVRMDCVFLYITHSLDFARTRLNSQILWIKNMDAISDWDYEILAEEHFSDGLLLEILGNRQKVLLVEGTHDKSIDIKLYSKIFPEYNVISLEGCNSVIQATRTYCGMPFLHYNEVKGIVDRDRRTEEEINSLKSNGIFVPDVAEVENLFLLPEVIKYVARKQNQTEIDDILNKTKIKTLKFLQEHIEEQAHFYLLKKDVRM